MSTTEKGTMSRRKFVVGAAAAAAVATGLTTAGLVGCKSSEQNGQQGQGTAAAEEWVPSTCNMCFNNCNILAHVVDGVVVELTGDSRSPYGWGHICAKGASGIMQLYDRDRATKPMKRTNPVKGRGVDPGWEEISWDEAFSIIGEKLNERAQSDDNRVSFSVIITAQCTTGVLQNMIIGSGCNPIRLWPNICGAGKHEIDNLNTGFGNACPDYRYTKYVIQFGTQAGISTRHGTNITAKIFAESRKNGAKLVNFDPHMSSGAEKADQWVPIRPGSDIAAALSLAYVLVHETGQIDYDFLRDRTNGPSLVDVSTGRVVRGEPFGDYKTGKSLYMDLSDNKVKPYDECKEPALEGSFEYDGKQCKTGFTLLKEHLKKYTPEYQEKITTVPAATIRKIAKEFGEAACIGQTTEVNGVTLPYRPAAVDTFSGLSRHKHGTMNHWSTGLLNVLIGSNFSVGGYLGYAPVCHGFEDTGMIQWAPTIFEPDGLINATPMGGPGFSSKYQEAFETDMELENDNAKFTFLPYSALGADWHFGFVSQTKPEINNTNPIKLMFCIASNTIKNWGNQDEMAEFCKSFEYFIGVNIYLDEVSDFFDLFIPESQYLEAYGLMPHGWIGHRTPGLLEVPWGLSMRHPAVPSIDGTPSALKIASEVADRAGFTEGLVERFNTAYRVREEYFVPKDQKLDEVEFLSSVYKSFLGDEYDVDWFRENGIHLHQREVDETYIWANGIPGRIPVYYDFLLEAKEKVQKNTAARNMYWEFQDYEPFPSFKPGPEFEMTDPDYDIFPVYWTNPLNTDLWLVQNPWLAERTDATPNGFFIEMNTKTAVAKGLRSGDNVRLTGFNGETAEGVIVLSETVHEECISVLGGHWDSKAERLTIAKGKGVALTALYPALDTKRWDYLGICLDQNIRVKIEKI